jgi:hypothetical protein
MAERFRFLLRRVKRKRAVGMFGGEPPKLSPEQAMRAFKAANVDAEVLSGARAPTEEEEGRMAAMAIKEIIEAFPVSDEG